MWVSIPSDIINFLLTNAKTEMEILVIGSLILIAVVLFSLVLIPQSVINRW